MSQQTAEFMTASYDIPMVGHYLYLPSSDTYPEMDIEVIERNCASGSFCTIDKGRITTDGSFVAIKYSDTRPQESPLFLEQPTYVPLLFYRNDSENTVLVEEWIEGESLYEHFKHHGCNSVFLSEISQSLVMALFDLCWRHHIYHADLTPSNILLQKQSEIFELKIIDFDPWLEINNDGLVKTENLSGSMPFMPPEYLLGNLEFKAEKAYVYCAGAIMYYMKYGYPPYCGSLENDHIERLMFGPKNLSNPMKAKTQFEDFNWFRAYLEAHLGNLDILSVQPLDKLLMTMLDYDPTRRIDLSNTIKLLRKMNRKVAYDRLI